MRHDNCLLAALPALERQRLQARAEHVQVRAGQVLVDIGERPRHAFFPEGGMLSLLGGAGNGSMLEVAQIGNEGVAGVSAFLGGVHAPHRIMVQFAAPAWKIRGDVLREDMQRHGALEGLLLQYVYTLFRQLSQSVVCHTYHTTSQRLSRWLLASRDRVETDTLELTQAFIADMLGVRRSGVVAVEKTLQDRGLIAIRHGKIRILNRRRLEAVACECYRIDKAEIARCQDSLLAAARLR